MPKIIENPTEKILKATRTLLSQSDAESLKIEDIASMCSIGVGTIYHYYESKNAIFIALVNEDWENESQSIICHINSSKTLKEAFQSFYDGIISFRQKEKKIFERIRNSSFSFYYFNNHPTFLTYMIELLERIEKKFTLKADKPTEVMICTCLLEATRNKELSFSSFYDASCKLFGVNEKTA